MILAFPVSHQVESGPLFDYPQRRLREITQTMGVPLLDLLPLLRAAYQKRKTTDPPMFFDNCHLTPYGSQIVAQAVYAFLKQTREEGQRADADKGRPITRAARPSHTDAALDTTLRRPPLSGPRSSGP